MQARKYFAPLKTGVTTLTSGEDFSAARPPVSEEPTVLGRRILDDHRVRVPSGTNVGRKTGAGASGSMACVADAAAG